MWMPLSTRFKIAASTLLVSELLLALIIYILFFNHNIILNLVENYLGHPFEQSL